jgi:hypothetical protein
MNLLTNATLSPFPLRHKNMDSLDHSLEIVDTVVQHETVG